MTPRSVDGRRLRLVPSWLLLNLVLLSLVALLSLTYPVEELGRRIGDTYFLLRTQIPTSNAVAMVLIDDVSIEHYGRWPWPRAQLARLVRAVNQQHPNAIGLDFVLAEASATNGDNELADAIHDAGNVILAAEIGNLPEHTWIDPLPLFRIQATGVGHVQAVMDPDGIARRVPLIELSANGPRWPLAVEMARVATQHPINLEGNILCIGKACVDVQGRSASNHQKNWRSFSPLFLNINFRQQYAPGQTDPPFVVVSAESLLDGRAETQLSGKSVLIGFGAADLSDRIPTPVSRQTPMPGVEVHANLLDGLLRGNGFRRADTAFEIVLLVLFSLLSTWFVLRHPGWKAIWMPLFFFASIYESGFWMLSHRGILLDLGPLLCAAVLAVPLAQLENLTIVNRALNRGVQQLRGALFSRPKSGDLPSFEPYTDVQSADNLQQKLDLVDRLQSELSNSYTFRQNLLESMHEALAVFDAAGNIAFRNPRWDRFCEKQNWSPSISLPQLGKSLGHPAWVNLADPGDWDRLPAESEVYLGGGYWQVQAIRLANHGNDGGNDQRRWMVMITDLTSRLERDQARSEALRFVTHELRTPLVSIQGFSEFLLKYPQAASSSDAAATIFRESQRLVSLINTYLDVLRFDAGARSLRREPIVLADMLDQIRKVMAPIADSADIHIHIELEPALSNMIGDPPMLTGVLLNLLNNAVKYSPPGSDVCLRIHARGQSTVFEIWNPGAPIPPEQLSHLFEPFYRAHEHETSTPGWGIGLTFVKRIVEEHGGSIHATSDESGIRVKVTIPS